MLTSYSEEAHIPTMESVDPNTLTNAEKLSRNATPGLYNMTFTPNLGPFKMRKI